MVMIMIIIHYSKYTDNNYRKNNIYIYIHINNNAH